MDTIPNNDSKNRHEKVCKNGCGQVIKWDNFQNCYIEVSTNQRHRCPNWKNPKYEHATGLNHKITPEQQQYADTLGPLIAKILSLVQEIHQRTVRDANKYEQ